MGDNQQQQQQQQQKQNTIISSRVALSAAASEIVEVQGGHIVRSTGRKDRHSKVCTAKGPRDRRVRLSAHTAIQFYDVQDRLGYDRPSKAVDWLMKKAKPAIDELADLPAWKPTSMNVAKNIKEEQDGEKDKLDEMADDDDGDDYDSGGMHIGAQDQNQQICNNGDNTTGFLPSSLDSDAIADTIKSFFPTGCAATNSEVATAVPSSTVQPIQFANYGPEFMSRSRSHSQDLRLSLQSLHDPMMMHQHHHHQAAQQHPFFTGAATSHHHHHHLVGFDHDHDHHTSAGWAENQPADMTRCQRLVTGWNADGDNGGNGGGGFMFNPPPPASQMLQPFFGQLFSQREPLQSSNNNQNNNNNNPMFRAWISDSSMSNATIDDHQNHQMQPQSMAAIGFASGGFSGFHIPARIQGEEEHDGTPNKLPSSVSRH